MKFILISLFIFPLFSQAQENKVSENDTISVHPVKSLQLGFNSHFAIEKVFNGENNAPLEFVLRKQLKSNQAIRIRPIIDLKRMIRSDFHSFGKSQDLDYLTLFGLGLGKEWQVALAKRWFGYYGAEFEGVIRLVHKTQEFLSPRPPDKASYFEKNSELRNSVSLSALPFMGLGFKISEKLFVTTEFRLNVSYQMDKTSREKAFKLIREDGGDFDFTNDYGPSTPLEPELKVREFAFVFRPYTGIFLNYRF